MGLVIRLGGALLLTRLIGPSDFGIYAGALAIVTVMATTAQLGSEVFLIRRDAEPSRQLYEEVFTMLLFTTTAVVLLGLVGSLVAAQVVDSATTTIAAFQLLVIALPLNVLWAPAQAMLERGFRFRAIAFLQVGTDTVLYAVAVSLGFVGLGVWAPIAGTYAASGFLLGGSYLLAGFRPRVRASRQRMRELGKFGLEFVPAPLSWSSAYLINPLVVGTFLGSASVGYVALATRLSDTASFVGRAIYRVSLVALSRAQRDEERLRRGFEEMLTIQAVGVGVPLAVLGIAASPLIPFVFGDEWQDTLDVLPYISFGALILGVFNAHVALLYVVDRTRASSLVFFLRFALLFGAALIMVPPLGLVGYGIAVLISTSAWALGDLAVRTVISFRYGVAARWTIALTPPLFAPLVTGWAVLALMSPALLLLALDRQARAQMFGYASVLRRGVRESPRTPSSPLEAASAGHESGGERRPGDQLSD